MFYEITINEMTSSIKHNLLRCIRFLELAPKRCSIHEVCLGFDDRPVRHVQVVGGGPDHPLPLGF